MKRFLFLTVLGALFITAAQAQSPTLTVTNNTNCTVYYSLFGDAGTGCAIHVYQSRVFSLPAGGIHTYADPSTVPGGINCLSGGCTPATLGAGDSFIGAELYHNGPGCGPAPTNFIGEGCTGWGPVHAGYHVEDDVTCLPACTSVTATWAAGATLTFN